MYLTLDYRDSTIVNTNVGKYMQTQFLAMPVWHKKHDPIMPPPPTHMVKWLKTQVLSKALRKIVPNLGLEVVSQATGKPHADEAKKLMLQSTDALPLIRQVNIGAPNSTCLYCRVVVPSTLYQQEKQTFDTLGNRFMGETLLYNQPNVHRSQFEYAVLTRQHVLYQEALKHSQSLLPQFPTELYARRSIFYLPVLPLLITEVFVHVVSLS